jgi:PPK2 family polyphosphate:nucleotide phosphotransferase
MADLLAGVERYRVPPDSPVDLRQWDPRDRSECPGGKRQGHSLLEDLNRRLEILQETLYAQGRHRLLVVLQAMDSGGKDGTIRAVFEGTNPQGVKVASFKKPTAEELAHDYLWRVHRHTPGNGEIVLFNRSHYEDVLVVRVHELVSPEVWERRYAHINDFERRLADEGTTLLKFYLHISKEEQRRRLQERLDVPRKRWKFSRADLAERARWDDYRAAYEAVLSRTSTPWAPWYIVPADHNWVRDLIVSRVLVGCLESLDLRYPEPADDLDDVVID